MANDFNETQINDDQFLYFGDGNDIGVKWDNTNSRLVIGDGTNEFVHATDAGTTATFELQDDCVLSFGADADFSITYDSANGYLQLSDGTNDFLRITDDGASASFKLLDGNALVLGTDGDYVIVYDSGDDRLELRDSGGSVLWYMDDSGAHGSDSSPTITGVSNVASSGTGTNIWSRVGDTVTCSLSVAITPTAGSTNTIFRCSVPIASNFTVASHAVGNCVWEQSNVYGPGVCYANVANDDVEVHFTSTNTSAHTVLATFSYKIV